MGGDGCERSKVADDYQRLLATRCNEGFIHWMVRYPTDLSLSLEQLFQVSAGNPEYAPTPLVAAIIRSWKKPLGALTDEEIGRLVVQHNGYPYVLDLVWPKLQADPLFEGGYYPGDVLSNLIRAQDDIWTERPEYKLALEALFKCALSRSLDENDAFRESLNLPR